jgi:hypothetical protein
MQIFFQTLNLFSTLATAAKAVGKTAAKAVGNAKKLLCYVYLRGRREVRSGKDMYLVSRNTHLISQRALDAVLPAEPPSLKLEADFCNMRFRDAIILSLKRDASGNIEGTWLEGAEKQAYAARVKRMQTGAGCLRVIVTGLADNMIGYGSYLIGSGQESPTILAFQHDGAADGRIILFAVPGSDALSIAMEYVTMMAELTSVGKICCNCGVKGKLKQCGCRKVRYCGKECQAAHWDDHREKCARSAAQTTREADARKAAARK